MKTRSTTAFASFALLCGLCLLAPACAESLDARCSEGACDARDGAAGDVVDGSPDATTDPCLENPTEPKCMEEASALFVAGAKGNNADAAGTRDKPFKTIGAALNKITAEKKRIYACEGNYPEDIALNATHTSVSIFGGINCEWVAAPGVKPVIGATANPWVIDGAGGVAIADVTVTAKDATTGSSTAIFVKGAELTLKRVRLVAGNASKGDNGVLAPATYPAQLTLKGNDGKDGTKGGDPKPYMCPNGVTTTGGKGGDLGNSGAPGTPGVPNPGDTNTCTSNVNGHAGVQPAATPGAATVGTLDQAGWQPKSGGDGGSGSPGQGGGGGYGNGGGGGGGAAGGCGGAGGGGGKGGGGSVALGVYNSRVNVVASQLQSKNAGDGGAGALGQPGQNNPGIGGTRFGAACNGGNGGNGGDGGAGGGGAGGISVGVLFKNTKPTLDVESQQGITVGKKGAAGAEAPNASNPGAAGAAEPILEAK
jgi:hypothetical protein